MAIGAFVGLVGFSRSFEPAWLQMYSSTGTDIAVVQQTFLNSSVDELAGARLKALPVVDLASPMMMNIMDMTPEVNALAYGWRADSDEFDSLKLESGQRFRDGQAEAMLGNVPADSLNLKPGDSLELLADMEALLPGLRAVAAGERASANQLGQLAHASAWGTPLIALLIGILGIANTMTMSVFERTREIGILRAPGWKQWHALVLIQTEATVLGVTGGVLGIGVGVGVLRLLSSMPHTASIASASFPPLLLIEAMGIALLAGLVAGAVPAWRGAHLAPVEALRHE